jgi:lipopolysaccharide/colanic/teichoic acid biosynthesis glycosyltransferase
LPASAHSLVSLGALGSKAFRITDQPQVSYGHADDEAETIEKLTYDLYYIKPMSPVMDLRIITGRGAR